MSDEEPRKYFLVAISQKDLDTIKSSSDMGDIPNVELVKQVLDTAANDWQIQYDIDVDVKELDGSEFKLGC